MEAPPSGDDLQTYNDEMYEEIDLDLYEDMHDVSTRTEAEFDKYVDISFRGQAGIHQEFPDHFHQYTLHPGHLQNTKRLLLLVGTAFKW